MKRSAITISVVVLVALGFVGLLIVKERHNQHVAEAEAKAQAETQAKAVEGAKARNVEIARTVIVKNREFDVCNTQTIEFTASGSCDGRASEPQEDCKYYTPLRWLSPLRLLQSANYVTVITTEGMQSIWSPTAEGNDAIGNEILPGVKKNSKDKVPLYQWTLILGCRQLMELEATNLLVDGSKTDFSWRWKPTELGIAAGLTDEGQRGLAYFKKTVDGMVIDRIYINPQR
jgi:hypothetical protein